MIGRWTNANGVNGHTAAEEVVDLILQQCASLLSGTNANHNEDRGHSKVAPAVVDIEDVVVDTLDGKTSGCALANPRGRHNRVDNVIAVVECVEVEHHLGGGGVLEGSNAALSRGNGKVISKASSKVDNCVPRASIAYSAR